MVRRLLFLLQLQLPLSLSSLLFFPHSLLFLLLIVVETRRAQVTQFNTDLQSLLASYSSLKDRALHSFCFHCPEGMLRPRKVRSFAQFEEEGSARAQACAT